MLNRFKIILKGILLYLILIIVTLFKDYKYYKSSFFDFSRYEMVKIYKKRE